MAGKQKFRITINGGGGGGRHVHSNDRQMAPVILTVETRGQRNIFVAVLVLLLHIILRFPGRRDVFFNISLLYNNIYIYMYSTSRHTNIAAGRK